MWLAENQAARAVIRPGVEAVPVIISRSRKGAEMRVVHVLFLAAGTSYVAAISACGGQPAGGTTSSGSSAPPPFKLVVPIDEFMGHVVEPPAEHIWDSVVTTVTAEGTDEKFPKTDEEWIGIENAAVTLAETGNLLMLEGRARDTGDWRTASQALTDSSMLVLKAAEAKDVTALLDSGEKIYEACVMCHDKYWPSEEGDSPGR
jgi:hypothetical protein